LFGKIMGFHLAFNCSCEHLLAFLLLLGIGHGFCFLLFFTIWLLFLIGNFRLEEKRKTEEECEKCAFLKNNFVAH
jgi:hypothetical protein